MMLIHRETLTDKILKVNWSKQIGDWFDPLYSLLESDYMDHLVTFIEQKYFNTRNVYPSKDNLFNPFRYCRYDELKVVFITDNAPLSSKASGVGIGIHQDKDDYFDAVLPSALQSMKSCISDTIYSSINGDISFDASLIDIAEQGVLFLNLSMTIDHKESHSIVWKNFIRQVVKTVNNNKQNIVFVFLTKEAKYLEKYIDLKKNYLLKEDSGELSFFNNVFNKIDDIIDEKYSRNEYIQW